jgi:hypothetical protein
MTPPSFDNSNGAGVFRNGFVIVFLLYPNDANQALGRCSCREIFSAGRAPAAKDQPGSQPPGRSELHPKPLLRKIRVWYIRFIILSMELFLWPPPKKSSW